MSLMRFLPCVYTGVRYSVGEREYSSTHDIICEFFKNCPALLLGQWSHVGKCWRELGRKGGRVGSEITVKGARKSRP